MDFESREYKLFSEEEYQERYKFNIYEKVAKYFGSKIKLKVKSNKALQDAIDFSGLKVTQNETAAFGIVCFIVSFIISMSLFLSGVFTTVFSFFLITLSFGIGLQVYYYPKLYAKSIKLKASSEIVLMILYITISMRQVPNLEHAVKFAALNLRGVISNQLKKLLWDVETRRFETIEQALKNYVQTIWAKDYAEVKEAFDLIISSTAITNLRREDVLKEAIDIVLQGAKERAKHYAEDLRTPVTVLNTMGILLPIIGLVMLPIVTIFLTDAVSPVSVVLIYNIMIPFILVISIYYVLQKRPWTFNLPDISNYPGLPKRGMFSLANINIPSFIPAIIVTVILIAIPILFLDKFDAYTSSRLYLSIFYTLAVAMGIGLYLYLNTFQKTDLRDNIIRIEQSFAEALFSIGSKMSDGAPIESSIEKTLLSLSDSPLQDFFKIVLRNIKEFGMTFEQSIFDKKQGAINYYPSPLMKSIFTIITKTSYKGASATAQTMIVISRYLKGMHDTEEDMKSVLSETTSSLEFQAWGLAPITTGIVVALAAAIVRILSDLQTAFGSLEKYFQSSGSSNSILTESTTQPFSLLAQTMKPETFQVVVGIYLVEIISIISIFYILITKGNEWISKENYTGKMLILGSIIYSICIIILYAIFNLMIPSLVGLT